MLPKGITEHPGSNASPKGLSERIRSNFAIHLAGGDTISTKGTLSCSATMLGTIPKGKSLKRRGAKVGDILLSEVSFQAIARLGCNFFRSPLRGARPRQVQSTRVRGVGVTEGCLRRTPSLTLPLKGEGIF